MKLSTAWQGYKMAALADGYSPLTIRGYESAFGLLIEHLNDKNVEEVTANDLREFFVFLRTDYRPEGPHGILTRAQEDETVRLTRAAIHKYWKAIRSFWKWADAELKCGRPEIDIKMPRHHNREIVPFTTEEILQLVKACDKVTVRTSNREPYEIARQNAERNKAILYFLLDTGLRASEFCRVKIQDINIETGEVSVTPWHIDKTRPRTVHLGLQARKHLWRYLSSREEQRPGDRLFVTNQGTPLSATQLLKILKYLETSSGVPDVHPHKFRHTFAIMYLRNGGDVFTLQTQLGHSTLEMVRRYVKIAEADTASAHRRASPGDNLRARR